MPLPDNGVAWPPPQLSRISPKLAEWSAWYAGDADGLAKTYGGYSATSTRPSERAGGVVQRLARWFWGTPLSQQQRVKLHVPVAADIAQASSDLLFAEPPKLTVADATTQEYLAGRLDDGMLTELATAAEYAAALGGTFLRISWDSEVANCSFLTAVDADAAIPEFAYGQLRAVTFWWVLDTAGSKKIRHLERHEIGVGGNGVILHGLYEGGETSLGRQISLEAHPSTRGLEAEIDTGSPGLAVEYVPNLTPNRAWRSDPTGRHLGRSDFDGVEQLMDALDETYTSWMRDIRLGKGRIVAARSMLEAGTPGTPSVLDLEREAWSPVETAGSMKDGGLPLEVVQFEIRVEEHSATTRALLEQILQSAGYSTSTFGGEGDSVATATEINARERRSFLTRDRKSRLWRPAVARITQKMLAIDAAKFSAKVTPEAPKVEFGDSVQDSMQTLATSVDLLNRAEAASTATKVRMLHPDWDDAAVAAEVAAIHAETGRAVTGPDGLDADVA